MNEIIRFVPTSERERAPLIRESRAIYNSIFPPADRDSEVQDKSPRCSVDGGNARHNDGGLQS